MTTQDVLLNEIKGYISDKLNDYKGGKYFACDLALTLTEGENANGSVYCNTYKTIELIKDNWDLFGDFLEYYTINFGTTLNPFADPEKTHVCFLICAVENMLSGCKVISDNWNNKIELNAKNIKAINKHLETITEIEF